MPAICGRIDLNIAWGLDYLHDFVDGMLQGPEYVGNLGGW